MPLDATSNWDEGRPEPSLKAEIRSYLRQHDDEMFIVPELREEFYPDTSFPSDFESGEGLIDFVTISMQTAEIKSLLEILVDEEQVDKRTFVVDRAGWISENDEEYEQIASRFGEENIEDEHTFYRAARS